MEKPEIYQNRLSNENTSSLSKFNSTQGFLRNQQSELFNSTQNLFTNERESNTQLPDINEFSTKIYQKKSFKSQFDYYSTPQNSISHSNREINLPKLNEKIEPSIFQTSSMKNIIYANELTPQPSQTRVRRRKQFNFGGISKKTIIPSNNDSINDFLQKDYSDMKYQAQVKVNTGDQKKDDAKQLNRDHKRTITEPSPSLKQAMKIDSQDFVDTGNSQCNTSIDLILEQNKNQSDVPIEENQGLKVRRVVKKRFHSNQVLNPEQTDRKDTQKKKSQFYNTSRNNEEEQAESILQIWELGDWKTQSSQLKSSLKKSNYDQKGLHQFGSCRNVEFEIKQKNNNQKENSRVRFQEKVKIFNIEQNEYLDGNIRKSND